MNRSLRFLFSLAPLAVVACAASPAPTPIAASRPAPTAEPSVTTPAVAPVAPRAPVDPRIARLARLARVWGDVRYLHPYLFDREIDWDAALTSALPKATAAKSDADEATAVQSMLDALHDPITRVESAEGAPATAAAAKISTSLQWPKPDVLVVKLAVHDPSAIEGATRDILAGVAKARVVVFDLRATGMVDGTAWLNDQVVDAIAPALPSREFVAPSLRSIVHSGYAPQSKALSDAYYTAFVSRAPRVFAAAKGARPARVAFVVDEATLVPSIALAMQTAGAALVVAQGKVTDFAARSRSAVPLSGGKYALLRTSETHGGPTHADVVVPDAPGVLEGGAALDAALRWAAAPTAKARPAPPTPALPVRGWKADATYPDEAYPSQEHRLLALFRVWNVIRLFYPYKELLDGSWDDVLGDMIPRFEGATDARDYALALAELSTRVQDGHVWISGSAELDRFFGTATPPLRVRRVEGLPTIAEIADEEACKAAGIAIGDVVVAVDGEPIEARTARLRKYVTASNAWSLARNVDAKAIAGAPESDAVLRLRGADGSERDARIRRGPWKAAQRSGPVFRILEEGIGYVDLDRLVVGEVDAMFEALAKTRAIVFDMRGYPQGTAWAIAPRLDVRGARHAATFFRELVQTGDEPGRFQFLQELPKGTKAPYTGKTVMLINARTQSQAEHTALFFEAANGTKLVGERSAGANGDVTDTCVPGGICLSFSGHDVRHADGRQLQRVGLAPDVEVHPTLAGLREGRDEILERAVHYLRDGK